MTSETNVNLASFHMFFNGKGEIVLIMGEVVWGSLEYMGGYRFFDGMGEFYSETGNHYGDDPSRNLVSPVPNEESHHYLGNRAQMSLETIHLVNNIPRTSPYFEVDPEGRYIDFMGYVIEGDQLSDYDGTGRHIPTKNLYPGVELNSMRDLLYWLTPPESLVL